MKNIIVEDSKSEWLRKLGCEQLDIFAGAARELAGEPNIVYIVEGRILVVAVDDEGGELWTHVCGKGAIVGLERLDAARIHDKVFYQLWAITDACIETIDLDDARNFVVSLQAPAGAVVWSLLSALDQRTGYRDRSRERVLTRVATFLREVTIDAGPLRLPRVVMARILSMRPETLSRALKDLEERGAVALKPRLRVVDRNALDKIITLGL